ncbi:MAG: DUF1569 domain-containing protein [Saprospiraceae bacterium]|nr:DUF1569 domain-containing protein [Saprospiraceae bacterium]
MNNSQYFILEQSHAEFEKYMKNCDICVLIFLPMQAHIQFLQNDTPQLLAALNNNVAPLWGKMTPQHMVEHLSGLFAISNGKINASLMVDPDFSAERKRQFFIENSGFPKNYSPIKTFSNPQPLRFADLQQAIEKLNVNINQFFVYFNNNPEATPIHPVFDKLRYEEWLNFHYHHNRHHFRQFELLPD